MRRGTKNDALARNLFGDAYDDIPKSVFAAIAYHLADAARADSSTAGQRFFEEWDALMAHGLSKPSGEALRAARQLVPNT